MRLEEVIQKSKARSADAKEKRLAKKVGQNTLQALTNTLMRDSHVFDYYKFYISQEQGREVVVKSQMKRFVKECNYLGLNISNFVELMIKNWNTIYHYLIRVFGRTVSSHPHMFLFSDFYTFRYYIYDLFGANEFKGFKKATPLDVYHYHCVDTLPSTLLGISPEYSYIKFYDVTYEVEMVKKKEADIDVVLPWSDSNFKGDTDTKSAVYSMLRIRGFPIHLYTKPWPTLEKPVKRVMRALSSEKNILIISNSAGLLTELIPLIGISFSLTQKRSSMIADHGMLEEYIFSRREPDDTIINSIRKTNLLLFNNIECYNRRASDYKVYLSNIIKRRCQMDDTKNVFTMYMGTVVNKKSISGMLSQMHNDLGGYLIDLIAEKSLILDMTTDKSALRIEA